MEALETIIRRARAASGTALAALACETTETLGDRPHKVIADRLRISPAEARRRLREAGLVAERATLTGQPVPPILEGTAKHWHGGVLDPEHVKVIAGTLAELPADTPFDKRQWAESFLADKAAQLRPDQLAKVAQRLAATINPDGNFSDVDRARKRGVVIGRQHTDGMSPITGWLNPELRASLDAVLGKLAAPGMCNPEDQAPRVDDDPDPEIAGACRSLRCVDRTAAVANAVSTGSGNVGVSALPGAPAASYAANTAPVGMARSLYGAEREARPSTRTAVIAWADYTSPAGMGAAPRSATTTPCWRCAARTWPRANSGPITACR